jgi:hypothetical protein
MASHEMVERRSVETDVVDERPIEIEHDAFR